MKDKRILKDFETSKMSLNIYTSPFLAFVFVFIGEFVAYTLYGISLLALIGLARNFFFIFSLLFRIFSHYIRKSKKRQIFIFLCQKI